MVVTLMTKIDSVTFKVNTVQMNGRIFSVFCHKKSLPITTRENTENNLKVHDK